MIINSTKEMNIFNFIMSCDSDVMFEIMVYKHNTFIFSVNCNRTCIGTCIADMEDIYKLEIDKLHIIRNDYVKLIVELNK